MPPTVAPTITAVFEPDDCGEAVDVAECDFVDPVAVPLPAFVVVVLTVVDAQ